MTTKPKILLLGATGQVGRAVLPHLKANPNVEVREFYENVLATGAEPSYMKCVFDSYTDFTAGRIPNSDEVFDNLPAIVGRNPRTLADFAERYSDKFRY
jgi:hypothetical protein